jgi:UDP-glucose 4-epimerase
LLAALSGGFCYKQGAIFLASSAGGVYAGAEAPPFTERAVPRPLAPYGVNKLRMEQTLQSFVTRVRVPSVIGRISNLYGPGQNLAKPQGLISQLARAHLLRQPLSLYVSPDTTRDYLYVRDCASMVLECLDAVRRSPSGDVLVKILAAERPTTIAALLAAFRRLVKRRLPIVLADSPNKRFQVRDLRLLSTVAPDLRRCARTTLPDGINATIEDLAGQLRQGQLRM